MKTSTQKTNVLEYEYDYFTIYSSTSTITLQCNRVRLLYNVIIITFMITLMNILFLT
ncbi:hypothetical protein NP493_3183g00000 [Ridgeia piscesae]|uniref:Uncharacterized protein n=1 Tax=Ridgeia piscesae TaxID=27915 RepID=A0AAD9MY82_RIDPI|nr:hypothetical protein NP493_3183g00000 [Ridgeia piscesae]